MIRKPSKIRVMQGLTLGTLLLIFGSSCTVTRFLGPEEELLAANQIKFDKNNLPEDQRNLKYELTTLYKQKPNDQWFFFFRTPAWAYYKLKNSEADTASENSLERSLRALFNKRLAEPPALFDPDLVLATEENMKNYLLNRGYFDVKVESYKSNKRLPFYRRLFKNREDPNFEGLGKKVTVTYLIDAGKRYLIDSVIFESKDTQVQTILKSIASESYIRKGAPLDGKLYDQEVSRITNYLRNNGYALFTPNFVAPLEADTIGYKATVWLRILPPGTNQQHKVFSVREIHVDPFFNPVIDSLAKTDSLIGGIYYRRKIDEKYWIRPRALQQAIFIEPDTLYNQQSIDLSNRQLSKLGVYRFVSIRQKEVQDSLEHFMDFDISLTPRKKWEFGTDLEPNFTERNLTGNRLNLFGLSAGVSLLNRNVFRGAESLASNGSIGFEINTNAVSGGENFINTFDGRLNFDFFVPRFVDYFGLYKGLTKARIVRTSFLNSLKQNSPTRISLGYNFLSLNSFYSYHLFNLGYGFDLQKPRNRYIINNLSVDLLLPSTEPQFDTLLESNLFLKNSFGNQLFTGLLLRDFSYFYTSRTNRFGESYYFQLNTELSGAEIFAINKLYNLIADRNETFRFLNDAEYSKYAKLELDFRHYRTFSPKFSLAFRVNAGIARPFGESPEVPYVKQFYVGGPQSIRAWGARGLGPGSYFDSTTINTNNRLLFYQTGDFKFEANAEARFYVFKFWGLKLEGALFLDMGNVWTIRKDGRAGGQLQWKPETGQDGLQVGDNFFREFAIGTGVGFRFDFEFFLLRFDLGYRIKNPYPRISDRTGRLTYAAYDNFLNLQLQDVNFNLGINYPF